MFGNLDTLNQEVRKTKYCHQQKLKSIKTLFSQTVRLEQTGAMSNPLDFYGLNKCLFIFILIQSVIPNTGEYSPNQFISHSIKHRHLVFIFFQFPLVI